MLHIPYEIRNHIYIYANNKCHVCNLICKVPYIKINKFYYCCKKCFNYI